MTVTNDLTCEEWTSHELYHYLGYGPLIAFLPRFISTTAAAAVYIQSSGPMRPRIPV